MAYKVRIKLNSAGVRALLKDPGVAGVCQGVAAGIAESAGEGYAVEQRNYPERTGYAVKTTSFETMREEYKNNTLQKIALSRGAKRRGAKRK